ncbi:MAG: hypothetical protein E7227_07965 [Clostridiales bacterium]|nr:hypothetical protein [Clostridiales bacterium]
MNADLRGQQDLLQEIIRIMNDYSDQKKGKGSYFYAFNPSLNPDRDFYRRNIILIDTIYKVLNEYKINIKSQGYTFIKDAICIIVDKKCLDVSLAKEIYLLIAEKYHVKGIYTIEHSIRNALNAAYRKCPERFSAKPTNKTFILTAAQEVSSRLVKELCA